jgi:alkylhydroperoxidase/carboxymuconolactone decarboxylase family protein YurZ
MGKFKNLKSPWTGRSILEDMKAAKTGWEMVNSWGTTMPSKEDFESTGIKNVWGLVPDEAPELIENFIQKQMIYYRENSTLDPKTAKLIQLAICARDSVPIGIYNHAKNAMEMGATKQEILDTLFLVAFECSKHGIMDMLEGLNFLLRDLAKKK